MARRARRHPRPGLLARVRGAGGHAGAGRSRRRRHQGRGAEARRRGALSRRDRRRVAEIRRREPLVPRAQPQQALDRARPRVARRPQGRAADGREMRRDRAQLPPRRDGASGASATTTSARRNPGVIYCEFTAYGREGPMAHIGANDLALQAHSGLLSVTGEPDRPPVRVGTAAIDLHGSLALVSAVLAALFHRERTGEGQMIETSLLMSSAHLLELLLHRVLDGRHGAQTDGHREPSERAEPGVSDLRRRRRHHRAERRDVAALRRCARRPVARPAGVQGACSTGCGGARNWSRR